ncbi:MAG: aspartate kinase [Gudongella sp.]|jgi:aspartate kinase|nr:aspartate kinase [Gudongella sp.]
MKVAKFGGSSLADAVQFRKVKDIVDADEQIAVVVPSAPGKRHAKDHKVTDLLYMCHQLSSHGLNFDDVFDLIQNRFQGITKELELSLPIESILSEIKSRIRDGASRDYCASRGEYINGLILSDYLGLNFVDAAELIKFDAMGQLDEQRTRFSIAERLKNDQKAVVPGFYGSLDDGTIKTFSRGGSDVSGAIIADGIAAELYENWTDVSGFLVADPKIVGGAKPIRIVTYKELRELSYMGAPVLHEEAIFPVRRLGIPINIKNTNSPDYEGTLIVHDQWEEKNVGSITGIAGRKDFTVISVEKTLMTAEKGFFRKLVSVFETNDITIEHMPSSIDSVSVIVSDTDLNGKLKKVIEEIQIYCNPDNIISFPNMALIAVVGRGMISTKGISAKIFTALSMGGVNIRMISQGSSELNIIIGVENNDFEKAIEAIYKAFE